MKILFMPGVGGDPAFWRPVADRLPVTWDKTLLGWPGLGWRAGDASRARSPAVGEPSRADATSGGIDLMSFDVQDWREEYRRANPRAPAWVYERPPAHESDLRDVAIPTLLIWATRDPISPAAVGRYLARLLPNAKVVALDDDSHLFARERSDDVAPLIAAHLAQ